MKEWHVCLYSIQAIRRLLNRCIPLVVDAHWPTMAKSRLKLGPIWLTIPVVELFDQVSTLYITHFWRIYYLCNCSQ